LLSIGSATNFRRLNIRRNSVVKIVAILFAVGGIHSTVMADDEMAATNSWTPQNSRFGLLDCLDHRSGYYEDSFPTPLLIDETDWEPEGELELNYLHTAAGGKRDDVLAGEVEQSLDLVTFELEVPYQRSVRSHGTVQGIGDLELDARCPAYQYVSPNGWFDTTAGAGLDVGIPVNSPVSKDTELEPAVFNDLRFCNRFTIQAEVGYDKSFGGGDDGGEEEIEYGLDFACAIPRTELPIPGVARISPMFEVDGELGLNEDETGLNSVLGSAGFRVDFRPIGELEPTLGIGYVFPMSSVARKDVHWGFATSFTVEF
jgi:hypothetical protein